MKTIVFVLVGALLVAGFIFAFHESAPVEPGVLIDRPSAPGSTATASATARPAKIAAPKEVSKEVSPVSAANGPAPRSEIGNLPVPAEVFDQALQSSPEGAPNSPAAVMHERFSREVTDPSWAPNVEPQVESHLKTEALLKVVDIVSMECRAATCEILGASPTVELNSQSARAFQERVLAMSQEAWWTGYGFKYPSVMITFGPDGRAIMIAHISTLKSK